MIEKLQGKKILHIGGYSGREGKVYTKLGKDFIFVEPMPKYAEVIRSFGYKVLECAVSDKRGLMDFNVHGQKSSLLEYKKNNGYKITVSVCTLDDILNNFQGIDTLVLDAQGLNYDILNASNLSGIKEIICEASEKPRYTKEKPKAELESLLEKRGFKKIDEHQHDLRDIFDLYFIR